MLSSSLPQQFLLLVLYSIFLGNCHKCRFTLCYGTIVLSVTLVYCGQMVGRIKMPLNTEVGLCPGDIVLDGDPAPPRKGAQQPTPTFWPMSVVAKWSPISATADLV